MEEDLLHRSLLHDLAALHHGYAGADAAHDLQVVRDEHHGDAVLAVEAAQQLQDLGLHRHVQGGGRLVEQQQLRPGHQCRGDHHALEHAAGALVGIFVVDVLRVGQVHVGERLQRALAPLLFCQLRVHGQRLFHLRTDAHQRVHGGHRLLEHHADLAALQGAQLLTRAGQKILPVEQDLTPAGDLFALDQARERHCRDGFAAARFAHQAQHLAVVDHKVDAGDGLARRVIEFYMQIAQFDHGGVLSFNISNQSSRRCSPSPISPTPRISSTIIKPVHIAYHGAEAR